MLGFIEIDDFRVEFFRGGDRVAHRVLIDRSQIAESLEGTSEEDWPASPPFQEVHFEEAPGGGRIALLVGQAGRSHWSGSVSVSAAQRILFDVACRVHTSPLVLGSTYRLMAGDSSPLEIVVTSPASVLVETNVARIVSPPPTGPWPRTVRWTYELDANLTSAR